MTSRAEIVLKARALAIGLTERERIALGATLVQTVQTPDKHAEVRFAASKLREHAEILMDAEFNGFVVSDVAASDVALIETSHMEKARAQEATTHTRPEPFPGPEALALGLSRPRDCHVTLPRAVWAWFCNLYDHPLVWFAGTVFIIASMMAVAFLPNPF